MEKQQKPSGGVCEKLFHALNINPSLRPLRRLTFRSQDPTTVSSPQAPLPDHSSNPAAAAKPPEPPAAKTTATKKAHDAASTSLKADLKLAQDKIASAVPHRPNAVPASEPQLPLAAVKQNKELNQKVDDFIKRAKGKMRPGSGRRPRSS